MRWPHFEHVLFDCDSTLTTVEGIDILAEAVGKKGEVEALTNAAMNGQLDLEEVYGKRLQAIHPTRAQIRDIRRIYKKNIVEDAKMVVRILQEMGHKCYIISGGLAEPVEEFGVYLGVPRERIRAVGVDYNELTGDWWRSENRYAKEGYLTFEEGALTVSDGKSKIVRELIGEQNGRSLLIGDGNSDLKAGDAVDLFVGYGGVVAREKVQQEAAVFLKSASLAPLLLLAAGPAAITHLRSAAHRPLFEKAFSLTEEGAIHFNDERLSKKFTKAYQAVHSRAN